MRPILSPKCFVMFLLLFLSGDIQLNPGPVSLKSQYVSSPLDVYEPFLSPTVPKLRLATLNSRSVVNKSAVINNHILENKIDILCIRSKLPLIDLNPLSLPDKSPPIFSSFKLVSVDEIKQLILSSPKSTCLLDPVPSNLLPHCIDSIAPIITRIVNLSFSSGAFSKQLKSALVKPLLKKSNLDPNDLKNYRPISNLSFLSK